MFVQYPSRIELKKDYRYLNNHQLIAETERCLQCKTKPCQDGCPCSVSPADFIRAIKTDEPVDYDYSALLIYSKNIFGGSCGAICPAKYCMAKCSRQRLDSSINIPGVQAEIVRRAHKRGKFFNLIKKPEPTGKKVAVIGAGPAGLSCAACLISRGHQVKIYDRNEKPGGDTLMIPKFRFPREILDFDINFLKQLGDIEFIMNTNFDKGLENSFDAVCYATGMQKDIIPECNGSEFIMNARNFLNSPTNLIFGKRVAIIGCGAVSIDVASYCIKSGGDIALIFYRRTLAEARLASEERGMMDALGISVIPRIGVIEIKKDENNKFTLITNQFNKNLEILPNSIQEWPQFDFVVSALGQKSEINPKEINPPLFICGQALNIGAAAVSAAASGKNSAKKIHAFLNGQEIPKIPNEFKSDFDVFLFNCRPASLDVTFNNITTNSPYIVSATPFTDSLINCRKLLKEGWGGVVLGIGQPKTNNFHIIYPRNKSLPIHYEPTRNINLVISDIKILKSEFPNSILAVSISPSLPTFKEDLELLNELNLSFIQINVQSKNEIEESLIYKSKYSNIIICATNLNEKVCLENDNKIAVEGCLNYRDAMKLISKGTVLIQIDPAQYARGHDDIDVLNSGLSISIYQSGYNSLQEWIKAKIQIDIEDLTENMLINHLTSPYSCIGCGRCTVCPNDAIDLQPSKWIYDVDPDKCIGCGLCVSRCPTKACSLISREEAKKRKEDDEH